MMLIDWLNSIGKNQSWLAARIGLSNAQTSRVVRGMQAASWDVAEKVRLLSDGLVMPNDLHAARLAYLRGTASEQNMNVCRPAAAPRTEAAA